MGDQSLFHQIGQCSDQQTVFVVARNLNNMGVSDFFVEASHIFHDHDVGLFWFLSQTV